MNSTSFQVLENQKTSESFWYKEEEEVQRDSRLVKDCNEMIGKGNLFHGLSSEDPYAHLATYFEICNTAKIAGVSEDAIQLNLLSFSLVGEAKRWLHSFKGNSLRTWEEFPDESLSEALDCFCGLLQKTTTHGFSEPIQLNIFIDGQCPHSKQLLDASAEGKIKLKPLDTSKGATSLTIRAKVGGISNGGIEKLLATSESDMRQWFKENYNFVICQGVVIDMAKNKVTIKGTVEPYAICNMILKKTKIRAQVISSLLEAGEGEPIPSQVGLII
ncbi:hypothetical protein D0Y65_026518 [Glycine soja]|uniref:Uncharacterized protein n=1 Tax=Glycine soja TaxID=3848 RepID=A0A445IKC9_GLYSO|nr:hypothetical protein D0Y65_026518 [Glycine soja]